MSILKLFFGLGIAAVAGFGLLQDGYQGAAIGATIGLFLGLGAQLLVTGVSGLKGQKLPLKTGCSVAVVVVVVCALAGPPLSVSYRKSQEAALWAKVKDSRETVDWYRYLAATRKPAERFRNPEWEAHYELAVASEARQARDAGKLRGVLATARKHQGDTAWEPARKEAREGLGELFAKAMAGLQRKGANPGLQKAFAQIIDDLSGHEDGKLYLAFDTKALLKAPAGDAEALASMRGASEVRAAFPSGSAPVIDAGQAFSPEFDQKRRGVLLTVLQESFAGVFATGLLDVTVLPEKDDRKDKLILEVKNLTRRVPDYYMRTRNGKVTGLMFGLEVVWSFKLFDRSGKELYAGTTRSIPATEISFRLRKDDPAWAPYSVMVGSTYYNFGRLVTKAFGLTPPPEKKEFLSGEV